MLRVFYNPSQSVENNPSFSPSAGKPAKVVKDWQERGLPVQIIDEFLPVTREDLYMAHDRTYVDGVLDLRINNGFHNRLKSIADSLMWTNGSFAGAAYTAYMTGLNTVSPTSGFHHAEHGQGMGFCTFNGLMVAALKLKQKTNVGKIAIIDIDMHYGNGTDDIIRKLGIDWINHYTFGENLQYDHEVKAFKSNAWMARLPGIIDATIQGCGVIFYQAGADPHVDDPFGGALTTAQLKERDTIVFTLAKEMGIPVVWNLAGGYQEDFNEVLAIHRNTAFEALRAENIEG